MICHYFADSSFHLFIQLTGTSVPCRQFWVLKRYRIFYDLTQSVECHAKGAILQVTDEDPGCRSEL
jgi:hypothetical protein